MKIENKAFWEKETIIETQDVSKSISNFEAFLFEKAKERYSKIAEIKVVKVFGCGTGREIKSINDLFQPTQIVASDISENMILKCIENLRLWNIDNKTETLVCDAFVYDKDENQFDMVTLLNSMLTYVPERKKRLGIFKNALQILKKDAVLIGTVHNQVGTRNKTLYFKLRGLFSFILGNKVGNRNTGFHGFKVPGYYYTKKGLHKDLIEAGFNEVEIYSLEEFSLLMGGKYNRKKGYNNLIFIGSK